MFGIKYCGGCNARYDRIKLFEKLQKKFSKDSFEYIREDQIYDHLIVICGCPSRCADISSIQVKGDTFKIYDESQMNALIHFVHVRL